jgi:dihydrofolate synthase / folylpolyglutamate synthase
MRNPRGITNMTDALAFLYQFINYERMTGVSYTPVHYNLEGFKRALDSIDSPYGSLRSIHVAGTKGKGSTAAILASLLHAHGFTTGLYTSPHLIDIRERFRIDGKWISEKRFVDLVIHVCTDLIDCKVESSGYRTTFECLTAMAFEYFSRERVDWSVLETGMGGRLDCTNVVTPDICVITPISFDHVESLGRSIDAIADEKAGILKTGVPVVLSAQQPEALKQIQDTARSIGAQIIPVEQRVKGSIQSVNQTGTIFSIKFRKNELKNLFLPLPGRFQVENACLALAVLDVLDRDGKVTVREESIRKGFHSMRWPGRLHCVRSRGRLGRITAGSVWVDGAHNPSAAARLGESIRDLFAGERITVILGVPSSKDAEGIVKTLSPAVDQFVATEYSSQRAMPYRQLRDIVLTYHQKCSAEPSLYDALKWCYKADHQPGIVIVTGSLYLVGEFYTLAGMNDELADIFQGSDS